MPSVKLTGVLQPAGVSDHLEVPLERQRVVAHSHALVSRVKTGLEPAILRRHACGARVRMASHRLDAANRKQESPADVDEVGAKRDVRRERELHAVLSDQGDAAPFSEPESPSRQLMAAEQAASLRAALIRLPDDYRQVILFRNIERLSFQEIGERMHRSNEAARKLWVRAVDRLRELLGAGNERA